ncbi:MAG: hypothetical protein JSV12_00320 [Candidatus Bathyarchaeota archaeon]|nr:MAG: hypothetical protein JSV12_00320 [Candidatus Bathyarchaeota archaeon]
MPSKYDVCWKRIFARVGGLESVLDRVRAGEVVLVPVEELKKCGKRESWLGNVALSREGVLGDPKRVAAHVRALKNLLPEQILPGEQIKCAMSSRGGQLTLSLRLSSAEIVPVEKVTLLELEGPPLEPSLSPEELGNFYVLISSFERELRNFLKEKIGKGWVKRLRNDLRPVVERWEERKNNDAKWGIEPERELINYADLTDYIQIVKRYRRIFTESDEELSRVRHFLEQLANYGRNPLMHCRTLDQKKYWTTQAAVDYLREWIKRRA